MAKKLLIVESPAKSKTIEYYLGKDFKVMSSVGHIRDLATSGKDGLGVDFENGFKQDYVVVPEKKKVVTELKKACKEVEEVYVATDPDREGEAIAWHLMEVLELDQTAKNRVVFNEITEKAIMKAVASPRELDVAMVESQKTRRILDRIIGFKLSKLLQRKKVGKAAGRVQSVALRIIADREKEIQEFKPEEYFTIHAKFNDLETTLVKVNDKKADFKVKKEAEDIVASLNKEYKVKDLEITEKSRISKLPYITSTLQQDAVNKLNMSSTRTMRTAQTLYEGVQLKYEVVGLITYMRTDSSRLSQDFIGEAFAYINENYGQAYKGYYKGKKGEQDAHEGIRVTSLSRTPEGLKKYLTDDQYKLYKMIYARSLASLMSDAKIKSSKLIFENNNCEFSANAQEITFDGYLKVYGDFEDIEESKLPNIEVGSKVTASKVKIEDHETKPKARYTEATLIKEMESKGIGRPATYAQTIQNLKEHDYVELKNKAFVPTDKGMLKNENIEVFFDRVINLDFTREMEEHLDVVAEGKETGERAVRAFYDTFEPYLVEAYEKMEVVPDEETGEVCPKCGSPLVVKNGRYGEFTACSNYPACKYIKEKEEQKQEVVDTGIKCPECGKGTLVERTATRGKNKGNKFYGCSNYPKCKHVVSELPDSGKTKN